MPTPRLTVVLWLILLSLIVATGSVAAPVPNDIQARIHLESSSQPDQLRQLGLDIVWVSDAYLDIITNPEEIERLRQDGFKIEIVHESVSDFYRSRLADKDMGGYMTLAEIQARVDGVIADHPGIVTARQVFGTTHEGRDWWAVKISDNPGLDEDEPEVLFTSAIHAREVITPLILLSFMDSLTDNYGINPTFTELVDEHEIWFVPVVNPDGYYHNEVIAPEGGGMWRKNRLESSGGDWGVDLNRNFDYAWGISFSGSSSDPGSESYRGPGPFSEPETQAYRNLVESREFVLSMDFHAYSNALLWPWGYSSHHTPDGPLFLQMAFSMVFYSGYVLWPPEVTNGVGMTVDWLYGEQRSKKKIMSFLMEVGTDTDGFWPAVDRISQLVGENMVPMQRALELSDGLNTVWAPNRPVISLPTEVSGGPFDVSWTHDDPDNPAVGYQLMELQYPYRTPNGATDFDGWEHIGFEISSARSHSASTSFYSDPVVRRKAQMTSMYPITVQAGDSLKFWTYLDIEPFVDFACVEISVDGRSFFPIPGNLTTDFNPYGGNRGYALTGSFSGWVEAKFDLTPYAGESIFVRLHHETYGDGDGEGFYVDDLSPHLRFDVETSLSSSLTLTEETIATRPMGVYYYQVRAQDDQGQWSRYTDPVSINVLGGGIGDIDLDGVTSSVSDLTLLSLYRQQGAEAFTVYPELQSDQTDIDCDGTPLSVTDLSVLKDIVVGAQEPCYGSTPSPFLGARPQSEPRVAPSAALAVTEDAAFASVVLQGTTFEVSDSTWIDIVLADGNADYLGFQFRLEYDSAGVLLEDVRAGDAIADWQFFDFEPYAEGGRGGVRLVAIAWDGGDAIDPASLSPQPGPRLLARLKFVTHSDAALQRDLDFVWEDCGDNTVAFGGYVGPDLVLERLGLSRLVFDADLVDITGADPSLGGADYTCTFGLFGADPHAMVDYTNGRLSFDPDCCLGRVADANGLGGDEPTVGDVSVLIDAKFITGSCDGIIECLTEGDVNQSGGSTPTCADITIGDISTLIDYLFITGSTLGLPDCL